MSDKDVTVTPELITEQLKEMGIDANGENRVQEKEKEAVQVEDPKNEASEEEAQEASESAEDRSEAKEEETQDQENIQNLTDVEKEAMEKGWKPDGPKSAEEFLRAEPLYEEIKQRGKEIKELKSTLEEMKAHLDKQREAAREEALEMIEKARLEAIEAGDVEAVNQADDELKKYDAESKESLNQENSTEEIPEVQEFLQRNQSWINDPSFEAQQMREFAQKRDQELVSFNLTPAEQMRIIEDDLKKQFPAKFGISPKPARNSVESDPSPTQSNRKQKHTFADLSPEQKKCARHFERFDVMKVEDYIKQLEKSGEL